MKKLLFLFIILKQKEVFNLKEIEKFGVKEGIGSINNYLN